MKQKLLERAIELIWEDVDWSFTGNYINKEEFAKDPHGAYEKAFKRAQAKAINNLREVLLIPNTKSRSRTRSKKH